MRRINEIGTYDMQCQYYLLENVKTVNIMQSFNANHISNGMIFFLILLSFSNDSDNFRIIMLNNVIPMYNI